LLFRVYNAIAGQKPVFINLNRNTQNDY